VNREATGFDHPPRPLVQRLGAILWPSFFAAGVSTMVLFAFVDPLDLAAISFPEIEISRQAGHTVAFLGFWLGYASACSFTWLLLRPRSRFRHGSSKKPVQPQMNADERR
jgi:H+/Cl- antiporter ClcA